MNRVQKRKKLTKKQIEKRSFKRRILILILMIVSIVVLYATNSDKLIHIYYEETLDEKISKEVSSALEDTYTKSEVDELIQNVHKTVSESINQKITSRGGESRIVEQEKVSLGNFKMTSYYDGDPYLSTNKTGSGKKTSDFDINEKGWYTYKGKVVVATATEELLKAGYSKNGSQEKQDKYYFNYYDELILRVDGVEYSAIVLDSCGAAMWINEKRVDVFVSGPEYVVTDNIEVLINN